MMHVGRYFTGAFLTAMTTSTLIAGDFGADIVVEKGSTATVTLEVEISTSFGTDTDDSTASNTVVGTGTVVVDSDTSPTTLSIPSLDFDLGSADFSYSFFCLPIIGCQGLDVSVSNFMIGLQKGGTSGSVNASSGIADFPAAPFVSSFDYEVTGLADIVGSNVVPEVYSFRTGVAADGTNFSLDRLALDQIVFEWPFQLALGRNEAAARREPCFIQEHIVRPAKSSDPHAVRVQARNDVIGKGDVPVRIKCDLMPPGETQMSGLPDIRDRCVRRVWIEGFGREAGQAQHDRFRGCMPLPGQRQRALQFNLHPVNLRNLTCRLQCIDHPRRNSDRPDCV